MQSDITEQLAELQAIHSPTPLWVFLHIYEKAHRECYINYMRGAVALHNYLTNNREIPLEIPQYESLLTIPRILGSYEVELLAKIILGLYPRRNRKEYDGWLSDLRKMERIIFTTFLRDSLNGYPRLKS